MFLINKAEERVGTFRRGMFGNHTTESLMQLLINTSKCSITISLKVMKGWGRWEGCAGNRRERRECGKPRVWVLGVGESAGKVGPKELGRWGGP